MKLVPSLEDRVEIRPVSVSHGGPWAGSRGSKRLQGATGASLVATVLSPTSRTTPQGPE